MVLTAERTQPKDLVDHESLKKKLFPLVKHPLYGDVASFETSSFLEPPVLADFTNDTSFEGVTNLEICPSCFFNTSGTTSRSKKIPFSDADLERQKIHESIALRKLGMGPGDGVMSLGAPLPSISGWAIVNGSEATGARALNTSQLDYETIFEKAWQKDVTFVIGTPLVVKEIGRAIEEEMGPIKGVLPNLKTAVIFGDVLPDALRQELKAAWGFTNVFSLYGTVEADVVATECMDHPGEMNLMSERLVFEFIPEEELAQERLIADYCPRSFPIEEAQDGSYGEILISDLSRDTLPLIRYRIGDVIQVHRATGTHNITEPTVSVMGRSKNTVMLGKVALYEMQLNRALKNFLGGALVEWKIIEQKPGTQHRYHLQFQTNDDREIEAQPGLFFSCLKEQRSDLKTINFDAEILLQKVDGFDRAEVSGDTKSQRIILL